MFKNSIITFIFFIGLGFVFQASASPTCKELREELLSKPSNRLIRKYIDGPNKMDTVAVGQCRGSCYFESTLSHVESVLSEHIGETTQLPRISLLKELYTNRIDKRFIGAFFNKQLNTFAHKGDILSSGNAQDFIKLISEKELQVLGRKSQALVHRENRLIEKINASMEDELSKFWRFNKSQYYRKHQDLKWDSVKLLEDFIKRLENAKPEEQDVIKKVSAIFRVKSYLDKLMPVGGQDMYSHKLPMLLREILVTLDLLVKSFEAHPELASSVPSVEIMERSRELMMFENKFKIVSKNIVEDVFNHYQSEIDQLDYAFKGKVKFGRASESRVYLSDLTSAPFLMAHTYPRNIRSALPGDQGILYRKDSTFNHGALHLVNVVDLIHNQDGDIEFLVIKNSWGSGNSYRGYDFLHKSLFDESVGMKKLSFDSLYFYPEVKGLELDFDL